MIHVDRADLRGSFCVIVVTQSHSACRLRELLHFAVISDFDLDWVLVLHASHHVGLVTHSIRHQSLQVVISTFLVPTNVVRDRSSFANDLGTLRRRNGVNASLVQEVGGGEPLDPTICFRLNHNSISRTLVAYVARCLHEDGLVKGR